MPPHYLLAVLDWGLGHASRCVPLVRRWLAEGKQVTLASAGRAAALLREELPTVAQLRLPPYDVRYLDSNMVWNMAQQTPKIARTVLAEKRIVQQFVQENAVDRIVSDGRFGCFSASVESIWLAHQLQIQHSNRPLKWIANALYHQWIKRHFQEVWVPDFVGEASLAGQLTTPIGGREHHYLGPLSRFSTPQAEVAPTYDLLALLSGPEPARTRLEQCLLDLLPETGKRCLLVRGVPGSDCIITGENGVDKVDWLLGQELANCIQKSKRLICRSGYSTLMDLHYWQKPALFIPTPGQTEQEYLARYWAAKGWASYCLQRKLRLEAVLAFLKGDTL